MLALAFLILFVVDAFDFFAFLADVYLPIVLVVPIALLPICRLVVHREPLFVLGTAALTTNLTEGRPRKVCIWLAFCSFEGGGCSRAHGEQDDCTEQSHSHCLLDN